MHKPIKTGVPQKFILGPLLYLIYVNDISNALSCKPHLFTDDTCLVITSFSISDLKNSVVLSCINYIPSATPINYKSNEVCVISYFTKNK